MQKVKFAVFSLVSGVLLSLCAAVPQEMSPEATSNFWKQVDAIYAQKAGWSKAERKIDSQILSGVRSVARPRLTALSSRTSASPTACETVDCNIRCTVSERLLGVLRDSQATVVSVSKAFGAIHAVVPLTAVDGIAEDPDVVSIRKVLPLEHNGNTVSEGVVAHRVNLAKADYGATGKGMTVGVISDGCDDLASLQASGDLPSDVQVLSGREGAGYEGGAMMEIVHDLAPSAKLFFASSGTTCEEFAEAVLELRQSGCDVIVDDVYLHDDPAFEEGAIAQAINAVTADGAVYVTCACNYGRTSIGNARVWNGDFKATEIKKSGQTVAATFNNGQIHEFYAKAPTGYYSVPMQAVNTFEDVDSESDYVYATLQWSDKWGASSNDYDLYVVNLCNGKIIASSVSVQDGNGDPFEALSVRSSDLTMRAFSYMPVILVVKKTSAQVRFFRLCVKNARLGYATEGWISGHHGCENAITCAAAPVPEGTRAFTSSDGLEDFSADGPCYRFFKANGEPYADGGFTKSGVKAINKPDITAADQVSCSATGFESFSGTSAAAPHAAAIAALMREINPTLSPSELKQLMLKSTLTASSGWNRNSGYGIVDALKCVQAAKKAPVKTYTMTWNANGGTVSPATSTFAYGTKASEVLERAPTPKRTGWNFGGWYWDEALTDSLDDPETQHTTVTDDATLHAKWLEDTAAVSFSLPQEMTNGVAIANAVVDTTGCTSLPTVKVAGLPTGLKFTAKLVTSKVTTGSGKDKVTTLVTNALPNTIYGTPAKSGVYTVVATVTTAGKKTASCSQTVVVRKTGENVVKAEVALIDATGTIASAETVPGKVTGMGVYAKGKKITLKATANKNFVFNGWYPVDAIVSIASDKDGSTLSDAFETNASTCLSHLASYGFTLGDSDVSLTAAFVTSDADRASIGLTVNGGSFSRDEGGSPVAVETNVYVGAYVEWPVAASALSATTVKVSGLPTGLKFTATPVTAKTTATVGGKKVTTVVTNVPANTIYGTPTAASKADKKGVVQPSKVVVTVTTAGKSSQRFTIDFTVLALPTTCVGAFAGYALVDVNTNATAEVSSESDWITLPCPFSATVDAKGGLSGSLTALGKKLSFKAAGYASFDAAASNLTYGVAIPLKTIDKTWTENLDLALEVTPGEVAPGDGDASVAAPNASPRLAVTAIDARRNAAKDTGCAEFAKPYAGTYVATFDVPLPGGATTGLVTVALTVDAKGGVKAAGTFVDATTFSASATLAIAAGGASAEVLIPVTGKSFGSGGMLLALAFAKGEDGIVTVASLMDAFGVPVSCAAKYVPATKKAVASYAAYDLLENAAYAYMANAWVGAALAKDDLLSVSYLDGETPVEALYAFTVTKGTITGVGKTTNKSKLTFKLDAKTGFFTGANGKTKVFGALYPAVGDDATVSGLGSAFLAIGGVAPVAVGALPAD